MASRGLAILTAIVLAAAATLAVFLYVRGVEKDAEVGGDEVRVVVAKQDILAGTDLDELVAGGGFDIATVQEDAMVEGAVTSLADLEGKKTSSPVLRGEQMSTARLQGSAQLPGGVLGIPDGYQATTIALETQRVTGGAIQTGDRIAVWGTFKNTGTANVVAKQTGPNSATATATGGSGVTILIVPEAQVLEIAAPSMGTDAATGANSLVTVALKPGDSQRLVFAQEMGSVWMSLLPPGQTGTDARPLTMVGMLK